MTEKEIEKMVCDIEVELQAGRKDSLRELLKYCMRTKLEIEDNLVRCVEMIVELKRRLRGMND